MAWGNLTFGRLALGETASVDEARNAATGSRNLKVTGREWSDLTKVFPRSHDGAVARVRRTEEDLLTSLHTFVPILFSQKSDLDGFYFVNDVNITTTEWVGEARFFDWELQLEGLGADNTIDIESKLGAAVRQNNFANTGDIWHAPSIGAYAYATGTTSPSGTVSRTSTDGTVTVYRDVPATADPLWGIAANSYLLGRSRVLVDGFERSGSNIRITPTNWEINNGLVRVTPLTSNGMLSISTWGGTAWESKAWHIARGGTTTSLGNPEAATVIRNDIERCTIRLVKTNTAGRTYVDLTLRRGSRFVEVYVQASVANTLGIYLHTVETATNVIASGYIHAAADDANGNRYIAGTSKTSTYTTNQGFSKASAIFLDAFIGHIHNGAAAATGDAAADLMEQYIGATSEMTAVVTR